LSAALRCIEAPRQRVAILLQEGPACGPFSMELAGLEPATSWVRSRRSPI
jgi:hypothetical protein